MPLSASTIIHMNRHGICQKLAFEWGIPREKYICHTRTLQSWVPPDFFTLGWFKSNVLFLEPCPYQPLNSGTKPTSSWPILFILIPGYLFFDSVAHTKLTSNKLSILLRYSRSTYICRWTGPRGARFFYGVYPMPTIIWWWFRNDFKRVTVSGSYFFECFLCLGDMKPTKCWSWCWYLLPR